MSGTTLRSEAKTRDVHDRVRGYTYSFHPAGVVHLYPLGPKPASKQLRLSLRYLSNETNGYCTNLLPVWGASSHERLPRTVKASTVGFH